MGVIGLDHVQLAMPAGQEERARAFYGEVLGLSEVAKPDALATRGGCWFEGGTAQIHLGVEADFRPARKAHPALLVDDLDTMRTKLASHGVTLVQGVPLHGYERGDIVDCFGNRIELLQRL